LETWVHFQGPGFTMQVPSDWFITATPTVQAMFVAPYRGHPLRANCLITIRPVQDALDQDGTPGIFRLYHWRNPEHNTPVVQSQTYFVKQNLLYTLTTTSDMDEKDASEPIFERMVGSFKLEPAN
jgi:hypothetical protein